MIQHQLGSDTTELHTNYNTSATSVVQLHLSMDTAAFYSIVR